MRASDVENGFKGATFHNLCNGQGPTLTIIQANDKIFGGFTTLSWASELGYKNGDEKAFLFKVQNIEDGNNSSIQIFEIKDTN